MTATLADIRALQATTVADSTNLSQAVSTCDALTPQDRDDWYALAARSLAFVGWTPTGGSGIGYDAIWAEGQSIRAAMRDWYAKLTAAGCAPIPLRQTPAAPPPPGPGFFEQMTGKFGPLLLLGLWAYSRMGRGK